MGAESRLPRSSWTPPPELCNAIGVKLLNLTPYSPDLNPIEEFFPKLKAFIKCKWYKNKDYIDLDFGGS